MKCEYCGYDGDGFEEGEFGFWCPDCQGLLYKNGKEDYSQADIILEKPYQIIARSSKNQG